ncbi:T-box transcription factor TBX3 [Drosophila mauritiana]|uniref:T-box transcription factor TBX3 n=1 Tax=Drosophila mauritiana TaxID=7226 RepID=A0A6P8JUT5_DROMA|nr:T-box transcription factor TBX3 [Drosophila mauritiana]
MLTLPNIADLRLQQQIAQEIYRQQIMQRLPDPLCGLLPNFAGHFVPPPPPPQPTLPGDVEAKLENNELWQQFHSIGTEMIITKCGRRMFPSMRVSLSGLEEEASYCVLLEMVPIGDCRYKFSGSQWVPAGGAEPQSPQRMYLHPESPATGKHWQSQALLFSKVKLTNNTLDNNGHIVLASMHKYQPRLHVIRTSDLGQIPWAPQQAFVFPETEFIAVTAYQNDRITKLKIDNNPFAKGFRESGQSRCKRKINDSPPPTQPEVNQVDRSPVTSPLAKRLRLVEEFPQHHHHQSHQSHPSVPMQRHYLLDALEANFYVPAPPPPAIEYARHIGGAYPSWAYTPPSPASSVSSSSAGSTSGESAADREADADADTFVDVVGTAPVAPPPPSPPVPTTATAPAPSSSDPTMAKPKRSSFSISDILGTSSSI